MASQKNSVNNEHRRAVNKIMGLKKEKKLYEELYEELYENVENFFDFEEKKIKYDFNGFDEDGIHKDTGKYYDLNGFNSYGINVKTNDKYNPERFDIKGFHKDTKTLYDPNYFNINGNHVRTNDKYNLNGFNRNGFHKDTKTLYDPNGFDMYGNKKKSSKIKTSEAKSFKDQKGKGHINLPIALSKICTNNSSKELINNIKQLINDLYDTKQITKQVYNNLIKAITYG